MIDGYDFLMAQNYIEQFRQQLGSGFGSVYADYYRAWDRLLGPFGGLRIDSSPQGRIVWGDRMYAFMNNDNLDLSRRGVGIGYDW